MIELHPEQDRIAVVKSFPDEPMKLSPIIILDHQEAAKLAEDLLRWVFTTKPTFQRDHNSLPERLASHMWGNSTIRHGLFSPPQFSHIAEISIRSFFNHLMPVACPVPTSSEQSMTITCAECGDRINFARSEVFRRGVSYVCIRHVGPPEGPSAPGKENNV